MIIKRFFRLATLFAVSVVLITCDDNDEITPRPYPSVQTNPVTRITSEGATFEGELVSLSDGVIDHGFIVSQSASFGFIVKTISLGPASKTGTFEGTFEEGMEEGSKLFVRTFAKSKTHQVLGNIVDFVSLGSKAPELISISPTTGTWGDKIVLKGLRFTPQTSKLVVKFDDIRATIQRATTDSIVCIVPADLRHAPSDVSVSVFGNISELTEVFQLTKPVITSIAPTKGHIGTSVVIKGNYFSLPKAEVLFGSVPAEVKKASKTELEVVVPQRIDFGNITVKVNSGTGNLFAETSFEVVKPVVLDFSPKTGGFGTLITITGQSLNPNSTVTSVTFADNVVPIISKTETEIKFNVPDYLLSATNYVKVTTESGSTTFTTPYTVLPPQITSIEPTERLLRGQTDITIYGKNFSLTQNEVIIGGVKFYPYGEEGSVLRMGSYNSSFTEHDLDVKVNVAGQSTSVNNVFYSEWITPPVPEALAGINKPLLIGKNAYIIVPRSNNSDLYAYDHSQTKWTKIGVVPMLLFDQFTFSINGKGYVGGGWTDMLENSTDFFEFNPVTKQWIRKQNLPFTDFAVGFSIGNNGYAVTNVGTLWRYNTVTDSWTQLNNVAQNMIPYVGFMHNGEFYGLASQNYMVKYNEAADSWQLMEEFPSYNSIFMFELNGRLYFRNLWGNSVISFDYNALNETEEPSTVGSTIYSAFSVAGKGMVFGMTDFNEFKWWQYKPYVE